MKNVMILTVCAILCEAQTVVNGGRDYKGTLKTSGEVSTVDFRGAGATAPAKAGPLTARPAACSQGQIYFATDAVAGQNLFFCTASGEPGTWSQMSGSAAAAPAQTAGTGGTVAQLLCRQDYETPSANVITAKLNDVGILGVCLTTQASGQAVEVAVDGIASCIADNPTTVGHLIGVGTTTAGTCKDLGQTLASAVDSSLQVIGRARTAVSAGSVVSVELDGPGHYGTLPSGGSAATLNGDITFAGGSAPTILAKMQGSALTAVQVTPTGACTPVFFTGTINYNHAALTGTSAVSIPIISAITGDFIPEWVKLRERTRFTSSDGTFTALTASMGRNTNSTTQQEWIPAFALMSPAAPQNTWVDRPAGPVDGVANMYAETVTFTQTPGKNLNTLTAGVLVWEVKGCFLGVAQ